MKPAPLPIDDVLPRLLEAVREAEAVVLEAPTGAGKTTRVPPALLDAGFGDVLVLEPRRLAARAAARRIAAERGVRVGEEVGYVVRFDRQVSSRTRLTVVTEGILVRRLQEDPFLEGIGAIVFDEFHERHLDGDLALALARRIQLDARTDLKLVAMSATLDVEPLARFLGDATRVRSEGRSHPVAVEHLPARGREELTEHVRRGVDRALTATGGDLLVFLPGVGEIRRCGRALEGLARRAGARLVELYGDLPPDKQDAVLAASKERRIVLSTNVAESSVTIPGITGVVDTGLARVMRYDLSAGLDRLELGSISLASAEQRKGRAGRTAPGVCVRLWSELEQRALRSSEEPEVLRVDLCGAALELLCFGERDPAAFPWFEPPREGALERALKLLSLLGATTPEGSVTELGRRLVRLPAHPRLGRLLLEGARLGIPERAALAAALLSERDPFRPAKLARGRVRSVRTHASESDVLDRVRQLEAWADGGTGAGPAGELARGAARGILRAQSQLLRTLGRGAGTRPRSARDPDEALLRALLSAYPDRLARRREPGSERGLMLGGRGVRLAPWCAVSEAELYLCVDLDAGLGEAVVRQASQVEPEWLDESLVRKSVEQRYDAARGRVVASKVVRFDDLPLSEVEHPIVDPAGAEELLVAAAEADPSRALPKDDAVLAAFLTRLASLREWRPELELPACEESDLVALLPRLAPGCRSLADLRRAPWLDVLRGSLTHSQASALAREAPERLQVPSGSHIRLRYEPGRPPVLAARIQELFGLERTPTVAGGRVRVLVHLLAPNGRPQQVTDDLGSFWDNTYQLVRKELRRRYPRHAWPEDPRQARAERRPRRRE